MCLTENLVSNFKKFDKSIKNSQNIMSMVVVFLAFESRNFLLSLTFLNVLLWSRANLPVCQ